MVDGACGEIYLNSIDKDVIRIGCDLDTIGKVANNITIPLIIAGGTTLFLVSRYIVHLVEDLKFQVFITYLILFYG